MLLCCRLRTCGASCRSFCTLCSRGQVSWGLRQICDKRRAYQQLLNSSAALLWTQECNEECAAGFFWGSNVKTPKSLSLMMWWSLNEVSGIWASESHGVPICVVREVAALLEMVDLFIALQCICRHLARDDINIVHLVLKSGSFIIFWGFDKSLENVTPTLENRRGGYTRYQRNANDRHNLLHLW